MQSSRKLLTFRGRTATIFEVEKRAEQINSEDGGSRFLRNFDRPGTSGTVAKLKEWKGKREIMRKQGKRRIWRCACNERHISCPLWKIVVWKWRLEVCFHVETEYCKPKTKKKLNTVTWVLQWTIPTERPPLVGQVSAMPIEGATWSAWRIFTAVFSIF
jgi:hypothetical protein